MTWSDIWYLLQVKVNVAKDYRAVLRSALLEYAKNNKLVYVIFFQLLFLTFYFINLIKSCIIFNICYFFIILFSEFFKSTNISYWNYTSRTTLWEEISFNLEIINTLKKTEVILSNLKTHCVQYFVYCHYYLQLGIMVVLTNAGKSKSMIYSHKTFNIYPVLNGWFVFVILHKSKPLNIIQCCFLYYHILGSSSSQNLTIIVFFLVNWFYDVFIFIGLFNHRGMQSKSWPPKPTNLFTSL